MTESLDDQADCMKADSGSCSVVHIGLVADYRNCLTGTAGYGHKPYGMGDNCCHHRTSDICNPGHQQGLQPAILGQWTGRDTERIT